jgi:hypothetical protein
VAKTRREWVNRMTETWNAGRYEEFLDELGSDLAFSPDPSFPDAGTYTGEEFRHWMGEWIGTWQENRFELLDVTELENALLVRGRWHLATKESGGAVPLADFTIVYLYPDAAAGRPNRMAVFFDHDQALAMAEAGTG